MISIMTPTRGRVMQMSRMVDSARATASDPKELEFIFFVDDDDTASADACKKLGAWVTTGPRSVIHSARWDKCLPLTSGELLFHANDDIIFRTPGWDKMLVDFFAASADKIWMVHGDDLGCQREQFGCHPCVHRRWVETLGYFIPPYFDGEYGDTWVNFIANELKRRKFLPFVTEHMHHIFQKAEVDQTTLDYQARQAKQDPRKIFFDRAAERQADAAKLKAWMLP